MNSYALFILCIWQFNLKSIWRYSTLWNLYFLTFWALQTDRFAVCWICFAQTGTKSVAQIEKRNVAFAFCGESNCFGGKGKGKKWEMGVDGSNFARCVSVSLSFFLLVVPHDGNWKFHTWWWSTNWSTSVERQTKTQSVCQSVSYWGISRSANCTKENQIPFSSSLCHKSRSYS